MFNITVAAGESFTAEQSKIFGLSDVNFFNSGDHLHGAGTLQLDVTSGSVKIELVARNSVEFPFSPVEGAAPIVAAYGTGVKLYTFSPVASPDMALRITDVFNARSTTATSAHFVVYCTIWCDYVYNKRLEFFLI